MNENENEIENPKLRIGESKRRMTGLLLLLTDR